MGKVGKIKRAWKQGRIKRRAFEDGIDISKTGEVSTLSWSRCRRPLLRWLKNHQLTHPFGGGRASDSQEARRG